MLDKYSAYLHHFHYVLPLILLVLFMAYTNPQTLSLPLLLVPFVLIFAVFFSIIRVLAKRFFHLKHLNQSIVSFFLALFPVILLLLSSANQLSAADVSVVILLFIGVLLYLRRADFL